MTALEAPVYQPPQCTFCIKFKLCPSIDTSELNQWQVYEQFLTSKSLFSKRGVKFPINRTQHVRSVNVRASCKRTCYVVPSVITNSMFSSRGDGTYLLSSQTIRNVTENAFGQKIRLPLDQIEKCTKKNNCFAVMSTPPLNTLRSHVHPR
ncbi:hypothetical protein J6590_030391 [Homalodisca vitripennis]|nr:hypothetical protein J6590_030391 [Homalodisca vitripennis]